MNQSKDYEMENKDKSNGCLKTKNKCFCIALLFVLMCSMPSVLYAYSASGPNTYRCISLSDCQNAVDASPTGWTVEIADGSYTWHAPLIIDKGITFKGETSQNTVTIHNGYSNSDWKNTQGVITITENSASSIEISDITFISASGASNSIHIGVNGTADGKPVKIHDCVFKTGSYDMWSSIRMATNRGIIYNNTFTASGMTDNAICLKYAPSSSWTTASTMGTDDSDGTHNVYIEDNTFNEHLHECIDMDSYSRVVIRHNTFNDSGITSHGLCTSSASTRHWEIYDNNFHFVDGMSNGNGYRDYYIFLRGGSGVITGNHFDSAPDNKLEIKWADYAIQRASCGQYPGGACSDTTYPTVQQMGQGHDGSGYITEKFYIWGNSGDNDFGPDDYQDECGNGLTVSQFVQLHRDFELSAKPGWVRYPYPHPLRNGAPGESLDPPKNLHLN